MGRTFRIEELTGAKQAVTSVAQQVHERPTVIKGTPLEQQAVSELRAINQKSAMALKDLGAPVEAGTIG